MNIMTRVLRVLAPVLLVAACSSTPSITPTPPATNGSATQVPADLQTFYDQDVTWVNCGDAECTKIDVPRDYADPAGGTVTLSLTRVPATGEAMGSIFVNPGGPGGSATDYARYADSIVGEGIRQNFDVVGVDPRGVANSEPITCLTNKQTDRLLGADGTPDSPEEEAEVIALSQDLGAKCERKNAELLPFVGTVDSARDLDIARAVVGDDALTYLGKSYGTILGATYAELFPERVGRMVLDGVLPADLDIVEVTEGQLVSFQETLTDFLEDCLASDGCPFTGTPTQAQAQLRDWLTSLDTDPLMVDGRELNEPMATFAVISSLYFPRYGYEPMRAALSSAIVNKDGTELLGILDEWTGRDAKGRYRDNSTDAYYAVTCLDRPFTGTVDDIKALAADWETRMPGFGSALAWGVLPCRDWPASGDRITEIDAQGANPILLVSPTTDPATPYVWAQRVRSQLENSRLVSWEAVNHTAYLEGSACVDAVVDEYLIAGKLPDEDVLCAE